MTTPKRRLIGLPEGAGKVHHYWPDAYCLARTGNFTAVFAAPPIRTLPYSLNSYYNGERFEAIENDSVSKMEVQTGRWYSLAYCSFPGRGSWTVVLPHQPSLHFKALEDRRMARKGSQK
ncbi:MAG: hypothetical protein ABFE07_28320 [Armatimonadia bacterium]